MGRTPVDLGPRSTLLADKHARFIKQFADEKESFVFYATEHFRMSGVYWGVSALHLLGRGELLDRDELLAWVLACQHANGGFGGSERHDPHLLYTNSAVQILATYGELAAVDADRIAAYVANLQQPDGSFWGDEWGEVDNRCLSKQILSSLGKRILGADAPFMPCSFSLCALACCSLLGRLDALNLSTAVDFICRCQNFDGGFGLCPGAESHAGQVFTCVAALSIAGALDRIDSDRLCWLCERQTPCGGLNGRPEKLEDVCYSWWCLSALQLLGRLHWVDGKALTRFILHCQDEHRGGISDRADDECDVFHTFWGIAALSLLGHPGLEPVDPAYAMPAAAVQRCLAQHAEKSRGSG